MAKAENADIIDLIDSIIDEQGCCIVFAYHHAALDTLDRRLRGIGRTVVMVDGRTPSKRRRDAEELFQSGGVDIFLGATNAAGESITLTRAATVVFVELDWVPGAMHQAENRGHRPGQKAARYHVITLVARTEPLFNLDEHVAQVLDDKMTTINEVFGENERIIGDVGSRVVSALLSDEARAKLQTR